MIGFGMDGEVEGGSFGGNIADAMAGTQGAMDGATAESGLGEISGGPGPDHSLAGNMRNASTLTQRQTTAVPTKSFADVVKGYASNLMSSLNLSSMIPGVGMAQGLGSILGMMGYNENPMSQNMHTDALTSHLTDMGMTRDAYNATNMASNIGNPHMDGMMSVPMSGSGARMGIATGRNPQGLNIGPGFQGSQDVMPGQGVNPFSGDAMADPSDPYIRNKRGTEIAAMIGP